MAELRERD